ncbi:MAG: hypothetical protein D6681_04280 [Calditrichaeota bacterium]|nr:MAG: hypothetical protein D6681_04280 [Calditrichota bacterium]
MPKYLIDANLPYYFSLWRGDDYVHVFDLNDEWTDQEIWEYARQHSLTIVTKDTDFSHMVMLQEPPPRVIHIRLGNMKMREFFKILSRVWEECCEMSQQYKLVRVFPDRIEGIG